MACPVQGIVVVVRICSSPEKVQDFCVTTPGASTVELMSKLATMRRQQIEMVEHELIN